MTAGRYHAVTHVLWEAVGLLAPDQRLGLRESVCALHAGLSERWHGDPSGHQRNILDEFERLAFRLRHFKKVSETHPLQPQKGSFFCIKCDAIATGGPDWSALVCPVCDSVEGLEFVRHD